MKIAWIDVETDGLDPRAGNTLLELAAIVTDADFNELATIEQVMKFSREEALTLRELANPYVQAMHDTTGLWDKLSQEDNLSHEEFDEKLLEFLVEIEPEPGKLIFGGNSITLDREFIREYLPKSYAHLSYRNIDMTSVELFMKTVDNRESFEKKLVHSALADIRESILQAKYHRELSKD